MRLPVANRLRGGFKVSAPQSYAADLSKYMEIMNELQHSIMHPNRRAVLETCKHALEIVLDMYEVDNR